MSSGCNLFFFEKDQDQAEESTENNVELPSQVDLPKLARARSNIQEAVSNRDYPGHEKCLKHMGEDWVAGYVYQELGLNPLHSFENGNKNVYTIAYHGIDNILVDKNGIAVHVEVKCHRSLEGPSVGKNQLTDEHIDERLKRMVKSGSSQACGDNPSIAKKSQGESRRILIQYGYEKKEGRVYEIGNDKPILEFKGEQIGPIFMAIYYGDKK